MSVLAVSVPHPHALAIAGIHLIRGRAIRELPSTTRAHPSETIQISLSVQGALGGQYHSCFPFTFDGAVWQVVSAVIASHAVLGKVGDIEVALANLEGQIKSALIAANWLPLESASLIQIQAPLVGNPVIDDLAGRIGTGNFPIVDKVI